MHLHPSTISSLLGTLLLSPSTRTGTTSTRTTTTKATKATTSSHLVQHIEEVLGVIRKQVVIAAAETFIGHERGDDVRGWLIRRSIGRHYKLKVVRDRAILFEPLYQGDVLIHRFAAVPATSYESD